jgi:hypothetical protein
VLDVSVVKTENRGPAVVDRQRAKERIGIIRRRLPFGGIGFGKEVGAHGNVGARAEELFWIEVKSGGIVGADLEKSDRDGDAVLEEPAYPEDSFEFGFRLPGKVNRVLGDSQLAGEYLRAVDADRVGMEAGFRCCYGEHGIECGVRRAVLEQSDHLVL